MLDQPGELPEPQPVHGGQPPQREDSASINGSLYESAIVQAVAEQVCRRLTRKIIATLQQVNGALQSGNHSGLKNTWDEICAQLQFEESCLWDAYDETVRGLTKPEVEKLLPHERGAVWLQTRAGDKWGEDESAREPYPVLNDDIVEYVISENLYREAANWSNRRIRRCKTAGERRHA